MLFDCGGYPINGLGIGLEHHSGEATDSYHWMIILHILCFRLWLTREKEPPHANT